MLKDILAAFKTPEAPKLTTTDARVALAALLVRVARADGNYSEPEIQVIDNVLIDRFSLPEQDAKALRADAEDLETKAPDTVRFTRVVKDNVPYEDRTAIIEALWKVVLVDGERDDDENGFLRLVSDLLGVNDRDSAFARQRAAKQTS